MNDLNTPQLSFLWADRLLKTLRAGGVTRFVTSPGFRNSPLVIALLELKKQDPTIEVFSHIDERGAAFFALGLTKASRSPAAILCTSGTAVANYLPAVLEAKYSGVPLVIISADRPAEMIGIGANQAMDQTRLFGEHATYLSLPAPSRETAAWDHLEYSVAKNLTQGDVLHINCAFREPFLLSPEEHSKLTPTQLSGHSFAKTTATVDIASLAKEWSQRRVLVLLGPGEWSEEEKRAFLQLKKNSNTWFMVESSSGFGGASRHFDLYSSEDVAPDLLVRFGPPLTSRSFERLEKNHKGPFWIFDNEARNPTLTRSRYFPRTALVALAQLFKDEARESEWITRLKALDEAAEKKISQVLVQEKAMTELHISAALAERANDAQIFLGNSMPIRDFNLAANQCATSVFANRGLSGIDGLVSTALGIAAANKTPTYALLGDLSTLHDINALSLASRLKDSISLQILVINNHGGEIFRVVGTNSWPEYERFFTTPQEVDFAALAKGFQIPYHQVKGLHEWPELKPGIELIEFVVDPVANRNIRSKVLK